MTVAGIVLQLADIPGAALILAGMGWLAWWHRHHWHNDEGNDQQ